MEPRSMSFRSELISQSSFFPDNLKSFVCSMRCKRHGDMISSLTSFAALIHLRCTPFPRLPDTYIHLKRMRSFNLSLIATIAFAAFSVAVPVPSVASVSTSNITNGTAGLSTVPGILTSMNTQLTPIQEKLQSLVGVQNIDIVSVVQPELSQVQVILSGAISEVRDIPQNPTAGVLSVEDVANLVYTLISLVITILTVVQNLLRSGNIGLIQPSFVTIGSLLTTLLTLVLQSASCLPLQILNL